MSRPMACLILAVTLGAWPAAGFAQSESPGGKAPAAGEEIKPKPGPGAKAVAPGKAMAKEPADQAKPAGQAEPKTPAAEQPAAAKANETQPAAKPTAEQPAAEKPAKPEHAARQIKPEQRTRIREVVKTVNVRAEVNVSFRIDIGVRVPRTVHFYPLPATVFEIVPEYQGYEFFLVGDEIIIVAPDTLEIVDVIPA